MGPPLPLRHVGRVEWVAGRLLLAPDGLLLTGYPGIPRSGMLLPIQEVRRILRQEDIPRCESPPPPTGPTSNGRSSSPKPLIAVNRRGRPRQVEMRAVLNTILSLARSGYPWDRLPHDRPPQSPVSDSFAQGRDDGPWQTRRDARRREVRRAGRAGAQAQCREQRAPDGQGDRSRWRAGLRRRPEAQRPEAAPPRGYAGFAPGRRGHGGVGRRRDERPRSPESTDGRAPPPVSPTSAVGLRKQPY